MNSRKLALAAQTSAALREEVIEIVTQAAHEMGRCPDDIAVLLPAPAAGMSAPARQAALGMLRRSGLAHWAAAQQARLQLRSEPGGASARLELRWL